MSFRKRSVSLLVFSGLAIAGMMPGVASAQDSYPSRPVNLIVGFAAGGGTDAIARAFGNELGKVLGQPVVVVNRAGAGGLIAAQQVIAANPDGYTLLASTQSTTAGMLAMFKEPRYDPFGDFTHIGMMFSNSNLVLANKELPVKTFADLIALVKANPGKMYYGSAGVGSFSNVAAELLWLRAGISPTHVPYKGSSDALTALIKGDIQFVLNSVDAAVPFVRNDQVRALAHTGDGRISILPDVPPVSDTVPGFSMVSWQGISGPPRMSAEVKNRLIAAMQKVQKGAEFTAYANRAGGLVGSLVGDDFVAFLKSHAETWLDATRAAKIEPQ